MMPQPQFLEYIIPTFILFSSFFFWNEIEGLIFIQIALKLQNFFILTHRLSTTRETSVNPMGGEKSCPSPLCHTMNLSEPCRRGNPEDHPSVIPGTIVSHAGGEKFHPLPLCYPGTLAQKNPGTSPIPLKCGPQEGPRTWQPVHPDEPSLTRGNTSHTAQNFWLVLLYEYRLCSYDIKYKINSFQSLSVFQFCLMLS